MTPRRVAWVLAAALILLATATAPAFPEEEATAADSDSAQAAEPETVEKILRQQEDLLRGQRFSYDPSGRRDPFRSLYEKVRFEKEGPRPKGIAGMLAAEIDLVGLVKDSSGGDVAFFKGSDNKGYFLRVGDEVYDAQLITMDPQRGAVTFRQQVDDPRLIKPYRDIVKRLVPAEEMANE